MRSNNKPAPNEDLPKAKLRIRMAALNARLDWLSPIGWPETQRLLKRLKIA